MVFYRFPDGLLGGGNKDAEGVQKVCSIPGLELRRWNIRCAQPLKECYRLHLSAGNISYAARRWQRAIPDERERNRVSGEPTRVGTKPATYRWVGAQLSLDGRL
jgi:hypothetical protein